MAHLSFQDKTLYFETHLGLTSTDTLLVHNHLQSSSSWAPFIQSFRELRPSDKILPGRLVALDLIGCGQSSRPTSAEQLAPASLAQDVVALSTSIGLYDTVMIGHDWGALVALHALQLEPDLFSRAILVGLSASTWNWTGLAKSQLKFIKMLESLHHEILIVQGQKDNLAPKEMLLELEAHLPEGRLIFIDGLLSPHIENPKKLLEVIAEGS